MLSFFLSTFTTFDTVFWSIFSAFAICCCVLRSATIAAISRSRLLHLTFDHSGNQIGADGSGLAVAGIGAAGSMRPVALVPR